MLKIFKYQLPLKRPFVTSGNIIQKREGILLSFRDGEHIAYGEIAPLPGFSTETIDEVEAVLKMNREALDEAIHNNTTEDIFNALDLIHSFPSLSFGLDTLIHDLAAKKSAQNFSTYLFSRKPVKILSNAVLSIQKEDSALVEAKALLQKGFKTLKMKLGADFNNEYNIIQSLRSNFPHIKIRVDANQAWSVKEAIKHLKSIEPFNIEYCEQPVHMDDISGLAEIKSQTKIPIAADESARNKKQIRRLLELKAIDVIIIKPTLFGTFKNIIVTKHLADSHNIGVVFTTTMEGSVARAATAYLAAELGTRSFSHGLATGKIFSEDLSQSEWLNKCELHFPSEPGLGIRVDLKNLEEI